MPKKRDPKEPKRPTGRPVGWRKEVNIELMKRMAARHCTLEEMSACLGIHTRTLRENYSHIIEEGKAQGKLSLRDQQWKILEKGSADMAKWLGRAILGQNEGVGGVTDQQMENLTKLTDSLDRARAEDSQSQPQSNSREAK